MTTQTKTKRESYCTFRVDTLLFGVEVQRVQEVIRSQPATPVPLAPPIVSGLMNLRGQIVTTLNLRQRLGLPNDKSIKPMNVVIRSSDGPVSLLVDEIGDVILVDSNRFELPPGTLQGHHRELIRGAFKLDQGILLILDTDKVIGIED